MSNESDDYKGPVKFGDIFSPGGALYRFTSFRDIAQVRKDHIRAKMMLKGVQITQEIERKLEEDALRWEIEYTSQRRERGVPSKILQLFNFTEKKRLKPYCDSLVIYQTDMADLILNADQYGYKHTRLHFEIVPKELEHTDEELEAFMNSGVGTISDPLAKKFIKKTDAIYKQRRGYNAHLFEDGDEWHLFWFSWDDAMALEQRKKPHWVGGNHLHFCNHLFSLDKEKCWEALSKPPYKVDSLHIRYAEQKKKVIGEL